MLSERQLTLAEGIAFALLIVFVLFVFSVVAP